MNPNMPSFDKRSDTLIKLWIVLLALSASCLSKATRAAHADKKLSESTSNGTHMPATHDAASKSDSSAKGAILTSTSIPTEAPASPAKKGVTLDQLQAAVNSSIILQSDLEKFRKTEKLRSQLDPLFSGSAMAAKGADLSNAEIVEFLTNE